MTALILLAAVATSIVLAWLTVRDVDAMPKMWRRIKTAALSLLDRVDRLAPADLREDA